MSQSSVALYLALVACSGVVLLGIVDSLTIAEAIAGGITVGTVISATVTLFLCFVFGMSAATVWGGTLIFAVAALVTCRLARGDALLHFRRVWAARNNPRRAAPWAIFCLVLVIFFGFVMSHAVVDKGGNLYAGYPTVWADWQQHLSTQSAFVVGNNFPPHNSLYANTPLLYPFLSDFHAAELNTLGIGPGASLALGSFQMLVCVALLMVCLALRLRTRFVAGVLAATLIFIGGGLGFTGALADACARQQGVPATPGTPQYTNSLDAAAGCSFKDVATNPAAFNAAVHGIAHLVGAQPRAYDGLPSDQPYCASCRPDDLAPIGNTQWYTPLMAWWLPQRPMAYGTATLLTVLTLLFSIRGSPGRNWTAAAQAGALAGLLPLIHVHALLALIMAAPLLFVWLRRKEFLLFSAVAIIVAAPRMLMITTGPHGSEAWSNAFPMLQVGWLSGVQAPPLKPTPFDVLGAGVHGFLLLGNPQWWWFWFSNLGLTVPLVLAAIAGVVTSLFSEHRDNAFTRWFVALFGNDAAKLAVCLSVVFAAANIVVFQSWNWDNTKLFAYWFIGPALFIGTLVTHLWHNWWQRTLTVIAYGSLIATGLLVVVRLGPWTPPAVSITTVENFHIATADERRFAREIVARTEPSAIFVTTRSVDDPVETLAGRTTLSGFWAWMWSYGVDFGNSPHDRIDDVAAILQGCAMTPQKCRTKELIRQYHVAYVEINSDGATPGDRYGNAADPSWWAAQHLPVVATAGNRVVYDVRGYD